MKKMLATFAALTLTGSTIGGSTAWISQPHQQKITTYANEIIGNGSDYKFDFSIQLNKTAWDRLLVYKSYFSSKNYDGFGGWLAQFADDNDFAHDYFPIVSNANQIPWANRLEIHMNDFGSWSQIKSEVAMDMFDNSIVEGIIIISNPTGITLSNWYENKASEWDNLTQYIKFNFNYTFKPHGIHTDYTLNNYSAVFE